jgi:hypothetical protein
VLELESAFFKGFEVYLFLNAKSGIKYVTVNTGKQPKKIKMFLKEQNTCS